ncbi:MAG: hypothetical protein ACT4PV_13510 [Planctomycetaceae bacterium]
MRLPAWPLLLCLALPLAACRALPPRLQDRSTPKSAYESFRGAMARGEWEREYAAFSPLLRERLHASLAQWKDARAVALDRNHLLVRAVARSRVEGDPRPEGDRAELEIRLPWGYRGRVSLVRLVVLRCELEGSARPPVEDWLPELRLEPGAGTLGVVVPERQLAYVLKALARAKGKLRVFEARWEWFLEDFEASGQTPATVRADVAHRPTKAGPDKEGEASR